MPALLHLIDPRAGFQANRCVARLAAAQFDAWTSSIQRLPARSLPVIRTLRRASFDLIHAWGTRALTLAALSTPQPIVFTPDDEPSQRQIRWLRTLMNYRKVIVACTSNLQRRLFIRRGIDPERCVTIRPAVDLSQVHSKLDPYLRAALGFHPDDRVILLVGDSTPASGHLHALWAVAILHVLDPKYKILITGGGSQVASLKYFAISQNHQTLLSIAKNQLGAEIEFDQLLPAADILLAAPIAPTASLPIAMAMASGIPMVATDSPVIRELLDDRRTTLLAPPDSPRTLAQRILDCIGDSSIPRESCNDHPQQFSLPLQFVGEHIALYRQLFSTSARLV